MNQSNTQDPSKPLKTVDKLLTAVFNEGMAYQVASMKEFQDMDFLSVHEAQSEIYQLMLSLKNEVLEEVRKGNYMPLKSPYGAIETFSQALEAKLSEHFNGEGES